MTTQAPDQPPTPEPTRVGIVLAPDGWTLHFPDPAAGGCVVEPIAYWTVYSDGNAKPAIAYTEGMGGYIEAANEGVCHVVPPPQQEGGTR